MTKEEIMHIASKLDVKTKKEIDAKASELLEILKDGDLNDLEMQKMEDCIYSSLIIQSLLDGEYDLLEEDRQALLNEMEELYNEYSELLIKAKIEEKLSKKKRMALQLMHIREELLNRKGKYKKIKNAQDKNREDKKALQELTNPEAMKKLALDQKKFNQKKNESGIFATPDTIARESGLQEKQETNKGKVESKVEPKSGDKKEQEFNRSQDNQAPSESPVEISSKTINKQKDYTINHLNKGRVKNKNEDLPKSDIFSEGGDTTETDTELTESVKRLGESM